MSTCSEYDFSYNGPEIPLLTYNEEDGEISSDQHALIVPLFMGHGNIMYSMPPYISLQPRPMVPKKDATLYGDGSVAWKDRMEEWKKKQSARLQVVKQQGSHDGGKFVENDVDDHDFPMMDEGRQPLSRNYLLLQAR